MRRRGRKGRGGEDGRREGGGEEKRERRKKRRGWEEGRRRKTRRGWEEGRRRKRRRERRVDGKEFHLGRNAISVACPTTLPIHQLSLYVCRGQSISQPVTILCREKKKKYCHKVNSEVGSPWG